MPRTSAKLTRDCATGKHRRCSGRVYIYPPTPGRRFTICGCTHPDCNHANKRGTPVPAQRTGPDTED